MLLLYFFHLNLVLMYKKNHFNMIFNEKLILIFYSLKTNYNLKY